VNWLNKMLPWPARRDRRAAIAAARAEAERSRQAARQASRVRREITKLAEDNHWAASIAASLGIPGGDDRS